MKILRLLSLCYLWVQPSQAQPTVPEFFSEYAKAVDPLHKLDTFTDLDLRIKGKVMLRAEGRAFEHILRCHHSVTGEEHCMEEGTHRSIPMDIAPLPQEARGKNVIRYALNVILFEGRLDAFIFHSQSDTSMVLKEKVNETDYRLLTFHRQTKLLQQVQSIKWYDGKERINTKQYSDYQKVEDILVATRCDESNEHVSNVIVFLEIALSRKN